MGIYIWKTKQNNFIVRFKKYITKKELSYFTKTYGKPVFCENDISGDYETLNNYYIAHNH